MTRKKPSFKALQIKWDKKLRATGFEDIENRETGHLKSWKGSTSLPPNGATGPLDHSRDKDNSSLVWKESVMEYYRLAAICVHTKKFKTPVHKIIWELHAEGKTLFETAKILNLTRRQVWYAVQCMQLRFGLKLSRPDKSEASKQSNGTQEIRKCPKD